MKAIVKFVVDLHFVDGLKISSYAPAPMALAEALHGFIDWAAVSFFLYSLLLLSCNVKNIFFFVAQRLGGFFCITDFTSSLIHSNFFCS